jgi:hypothetical protein
MRIRLFALVLAAGGCNGPTTCMIDSDCSGQVCGADGQCYGETDVRSVTLTWTVGLAPPTATNCARFGGFAAEFSEQMCDEAEDETAGPLIDTTLTCTDGTAVVANVPMTYTWAVVGAQGNFCQDQSIPTSNALSFDIE